MTPAQFAIYAALAALTTLYAGLLNRHKHKWEPRYTWVEVAVGNGICLAAPTLCVALDPTLAAWTVALLYLAAFIIGGLPIIIWQLSLNHALDRERLERALKKGSARYGNPAPTVAPQPERTSRQHAGASDKCATPDSGDAGRPADGADAHQAQPGSGS